MAVKLGHGRAARGYSARRKYSPMADINVTPMVDVMLVLLVIFMVAAPLATVDLPVDLPSAAAAPQPRPDKPIFLTVKADHSLALGENAVSAADLASALDQASSNDHDTRVYLRADQGIAYGELMQVMNVLRRAGYLKLALVGMEDGDGP